MTRHAWAALMVALVAFCLWVLSKPMADGGLILAGWAAGIAAAVIANCRVWPATDDEEMA